MTHDEIINMGRGAGAVVTTTIEELEQEIYENTRQFVPTSVMQWMLSRYYTTTKKHQDDIISLARLAGIEFHGGFVRAAECVTQPMLVRFAELVAAAEREACAKTVEDMEHGNVRTCAAAIRARGNT